MGTLPLTPQQRHAVTTSGHSVIVSAAAGSGKTAVLAERYAHLICDLPADQRANVDQLLVLTFTDAAAAEMRGRIEETLHTRLQTDPENRRLREQIALLDAAHISTVHSFCHWLIRRWFNEAGLDPTTSVLDADEAALLKRETLAGLFDQLYQQVETTAPPGSKQEPDLSQATGREHLSIAVNPEVEQNSLLCSGVSPAEGLRGYGNPRGLKPAARNAGAGTALAAGFNELVEVYGLGEDRDVATLVLQLHDFVASLPDPDGWLEDAWAIVAKPQARALPKLEVDLERELTWQIEYCELATARAEAVGQVGQHYATQIQDYVERLREWRTTLQQINADHSTTDVRTDEAPTVLGRYETVRHNISEFAFNSAQGPRLAKGTDPAITRARDRARQELTAVKDHLFQDRLKKRFALFSVDEWVEGLEFVAPFIATIADLVTAFRNAYSAEKRKLTTLDFSDLERFAFDLLHRADTSDQASDVARALQCRFAYVLVDEFQDINPIQHEIIRLASREAGDLPNNLFVVGDVKQSIYRFRLAEPTVFAHRHDAFREATCADEAIALQANFRSRP
ncbi:MAG: UvrD-helicase domain-containing protein, partial [Planctomycetes bacterium]|nr:UvrD-helicase domain-containing protein [Planctomycetota bacterium]